MPVQRTESAAAPTDPVVKPSGPVSAPTFDPTDTIADVFDATQELLLDAVPDPKRVAEKLLDLALEKVPADAGTFYLADVNGHELSFAAVRGPKADAIRKKSLTVPVGQGVVGFCAQEGVCLVIRDMQNDSRYFSAIAEAVGYQPKDSLCASAEKEGRLFGAIQLINHKKGGFTPGEMEVIRYIGITAADMLARVAEA
jgi:GAF domain-containing protein